MKSIYKKQYKLLIEWVVSKRLIAGLTQVELASKLNKPQSYISKIESCERRLDLIEFIDICSVIKADPTEVIELLQQEYRDE